jgi:hypothetical protein
VGTAVKDRIRTAWFRNIAPKNPTQIRYRRFVRGTGAESQDAFSKSQRAFEKRMKREEMEDLLKEY